MVRERAGSLFWRVCVTNAVVFLLGTLVLVLAPVTVSERPLWSEVVVVSVGAAVIVVLNALLLRSLLRPMDRLTSAMASIDPRHPGQRLDEVGSGPAQPLVRSFNAMLDRLEVERSVSTARALHAQEAERQRISQELHDEVGQSLTAVLLGLKQAIRTAPPEVVEELEQARETTRASLEEVRRISQALRPGVLADLGLVDSLSSLASDLTARTGVVVTRGFGPGLPSLAPETELVVYRVAQEALTNVARHARAERVHLGLTRRGDALVLRVADDGVGIGGAPVGAGVQGMQERAQMVGGRLSVGANEGGGTEVLLDVPLDAPGAAA
ncbi:HAMP domain-containing sensor histidine kinase [Nocardioides marmoribigeumensis]|uniref:histidine kinase n=1 Tax=Nocardioides marmoribigeumensis TaxID=433649 RepID=A0ABU2BPV8_9ACTN|nr:HAMP domain-containing sensor histidine kinase [Nocardioides marmoribigeumensis]MDR7360665.1 two-component system sensor histidine kinase UhpB [Nocardioides marmoribigeumensis]